MATKKAAALSLVAKAAELAALAEYQTNAIVSRPLIQRQTGSATLFAFAAGQALSEHTAPYDAMVYMVAGSAEITIAGKKQQVREGEAIIMPGGVPHAVKAVKDFKMLLVMIRSKE
jgi:quercetin dioxygenase-like cupin family protein